MDASKFSKIVKEAINLIPEKFLKKLNNVAIVIEDEPTLEQKRKLKLGNSLAVFGLYEGVPQSRRSHYGAVLPDKITIFRKPIEQMAENEEQIKRIVKNAVWHEIAHHFGMSESEVRQAEEKKRYNRK